jgi:N-acyl-D-aspartate/D-glutamate deacylase
MAEFDLVIRRGTLVDGNGGAPRVADVAVRDGVVVEVGEVSGQGEREIDAAGLVVGPGFVDIHTHYDGQAVWDDRLQPSSLHGVTTVVAGNCGVGFAPVKPDDRYKLIELMEGVEDIPGTALYAGLEQHWSWSTFSEYLNVLGSRAYDIDIATQVPHAALRFWAMGDRAAALEAATEAEIADMAEMAAQAVRDGALGFSTSRTINHKSRSGDVTPTYGSEARELTTIAAAVGATGTGVLQFVTDYDDLDDDFGIMRSMVTASGRPLSVSLLQKRKLPRLYQPTLDKITESNQAGIPIRAQVASRGVGIMLGLTCTVHPFVTNPVWRTLAGLPVAEQAARMADPETRAAILAAQTAEVPENLGPGALRINRYEAMWELGEYPEYEPSLDDTILARATREGRSPEDLAYDILISDQGRGMIQQPFTNYADGNLEAVREMLTHPYTVPGLGDGGAHVGAICDSSFTSTLLQHWARDRGEGRLPIEYVFQKQSRDTAQTVGLNDRGVLAPGYRADIIVVDMEHLRMRRPEIIYDLPGGERRFRQEVEGYRHTFVAGVETYADGQPTGALPGRLVRGAREAAPELVGTIPRRG